MHTPFAHRASSKNPTLESSASSSRTITISTREHRRLCWAARHATVDSLTGALTRHGLSERLQKFARDLNAGLEPAFAVAVLHLVDFKRLNDRRWQARGDEALAGQQLRASLRNLDHLLPVFSSLRSPRRDSGKNSTTQQLRREHLRNLLNEIVAQRK